MFTVRNSLIAAFLLLMVAQVGHACSIPSTFLDAYTDGVTVFADASISDTGANVWVRVVISKPDGQTGGSDLAGGVDYAAASASSPVNGQYGDWPSTATYFSDTAATQPSPQTVQVTVKGIVRITSTTSSASTIYINGIPNCTNITVQVEVDRGLIAEAPTVSLSYAKSSSIPDTITLQINPIGETATLTQTSSRVVQVCNGSNQNTGSWTFRGAILGVDPSAKYNVGNPQNDTTTLIVNQ